jgi:hypothetical protein
MNRYAVIKIFLITLFSTASHCTVIAQATAVYTPTDVEIWRSKVRVATTDPVPLRVTAIAKSFVHTPYQAHTLEATPNEQLIVNLRGLDCTTFVESTLALATTGQSDTTFESYCRRLQQLRYRDDAIAGYSSRLHYLSDWLYENQRKGIIEDLTRQLGGKPYPKKLQFMSTHRQAYRQLEAEDNYQDLLRTEATLANRKLFYIPKNEILLIEKGLNEGDIITITTSIPGLDASHVGFAIRQKGRVHLLHASSDAGRVVISEKPLAEYLAGKKSQTGIIVARPK